LFDWHEARSWNVETLKGWNLKPEGGKRKAMSRAGARLVAGVAARRVLSSTDIFGLDTGP
jgi:hypothetical protein